MIQALGYLAAVVVLIAANALFVAAEFALVAIEPYQAEQAAADGGDRRSRSVLRAVKSLSFQLSGAQLGITVTSLAVGYLAEPALATLFHPVLTAVGLPDAPSSAIALVIALIVATVTQMVFGELVPKNWAISEPIRVGRAVAGPQVLLSRLGSPLIRLLNHAANAILHLFGVEPQDELRSGRSAAELGSIVRSSARQGTLPISTASLLRRSLRFGDRKAEDVMTPRVRTVWIDADASVVELLRLAETSGHSRFPVRGTPGTAETVEGTEPAVEPVEAVEAPRPAQPVRPLPGGRADGGRADGAGRDARAARERDARLAREREARLTEEQDAASEEDLDGMVGVVHVKDVFAIPHERRPTVPVREIMVPPLLVPASLDCDTLLARLRHHGLQLAAVIDEYGGTAGIVTMEDLVEELVGEVSDEHDLPGLPGVVPDGPGAWLLSGLLRPDEAADATGVRLPEGPYETVAGLVLARLGRLGRVGDRVEVDDSELTVLSLDRHRIERVRLSTGPGTGSSPPPSAPATAPRPDAPRPESPREAPRPDGARTDAARTDGARSDGARSEAPPNARPSGTRR